MQQSEKLACIYTQCMVINNSLVINKPCYPLIGFHFSPKIKEKMKINAQSYIYTMQEEQIESNVSWPGLLYDKSNTNKK